MVAARELWLRDADTAIRRATDRRGSGPVPLSPTGSRVATIDALLARKSTHFFTDAHYELHELQRIAERAIDAAAGVIPSVRLDLLVLMRRDGCFTEATLVMAGGDVAPLPAWTPLSVDGPRRPVLQDDLVNAAGLLVLCAPRGSVVDDWGRYRLLLLKTGYLAAACTVEATADGIPSCLASAVNRPAFRAAMGGREAPYVPMMMLAVGGPSDERP